MTSLWNDIRLDHIWDDANGINYRDESELSLAIATYAHLHGWFVQREVVIPGWGRLDLVLSHPSTCRILAVELKRELRRPAVIRRAFQQAEGYRRWLDENFSLVGAVDTVILSSPAKGSDEQAIHKVNVLYPDVAYKAVSAVLGLLSDVPGSGDEVQSLMQQEVATTRLSAARREVRLREFACAALSARHAEKYPHVEPEPTS